MNGQILYPVGIQTFEKIREENYLYVDKTDLVYRMTHSGTNYLFLSRPRRFGKSLLISTLKSYFEGRKDLFEGLAIEKLETEWTKHPVLHFSMASGKHLEKDALERYIHFQLDCQEEPYKIEETSTDTNVRLYNLIKAAYEQTGQKVVVLIDEYDAPLLDVVHEEKELPVLRNVMRNFYSPLKDCDPYLRFVFLTGITKFSQLSIFSELNNIRNISMEPDYAALCGITKEELLENFSVGIQQMAEKQGLTHEATIEALTRMYDGYHFAWPSPDIFNPFSLLNAFKGSDLKPYWFGSGTPTYLLEMMQQFDYPPTSLCRTSAQASDFDAPTQSMESALPLLYQSGYLTIKDHDPIFDDYVLDVPNKEVRIGLMQSLIKYYIAPNPAPTKNTAVSIARCLYKDDMEGALHTLQTFLASVPYTRDTNYEGHWQQVLFIIFSLLGQYCDVEVHTSKGRVDLVLVTKFRVFLIETKLNRSAEAALEQTALRDYDARSALYTLPVTKVGINFDCEETHTLIDWNIEDVA